MIEILKELSVLPGISGRERAVRDYIINKVSGLNSESSSTDVKVMPTGSVVVFKKGAKIPKTKMMIAAHMDEIGLIVTSITDDGMLKFDTVGGISPSVFPGCAVMCGEGLFPGVIGVPPIHLTAESDKGKAPKSSSLYIDIGAREKREAEKRVKPGDVCVFDSSFESFGDKLLKGKALDDRAGCAVLLDILSRDLPFDLWFAFTTMEEVGLRGAGCAANAVNPDVAIIVEATTAADLPGVAPENRVCRVGGGAVVGFMDRQTIYDRGLYESSLRIAGEKKIPVQIKSAIAGSNDAGAISRSGGGVRTLAVSLPCRYIHSPASVIAESDLESVRELVFELVQSL